MSDGYWSLPELLRRMPAPGEPITDGRPYLREEAPNEFVIAGIGYLPIVDYIWATFGAAGFPDEGQFDYIAWRDEVLSRSGSDRFTSIMSRT